MRRSRAWILGLLLAAGAGVAPGADTNSVRVLNLDECLTLALEHSGLALNARRDEAIAQTVMTQARSEALPQLSLDANYNRLDELQPFEIEGETVELGTLDNYSTGVRVRQLLYAGGRVGAALRAAGLSREHAAAQRREVENAIREQVRAGFYRILLAQATVAVRIETVAQLQALLDQTEARFRQGTAAEFDAISARVRLANEQPERIAASNELEVARADYRRLLDLPDGPFRLDGSLECVPWTESLPALIEFALATRPLLQVLEKAVDLRGESIIATRSGNLPSLSADAGYSGANSYGFTGLDDDWQWHWDAGVALSWSLWDGNRTRGAVAQRRLEKLKSETDLDEGRKQVRLDVTQAWLDMQHALEAVRAAEGNVALAGRALQIAQARYGVGLATRLDATDATLALSAARLTESRARFAHMRAAARLQYVCGADEAEIRRESDGKP